MKCKEHLCLISHSTDLAPFPGRAHSERANVNNVKKSQRQISNILNVSMCFIWENTHCPNAKMDNKDEWKNKDRTVKYPTMSITTSARFPYIWYIKDICVLKRQNDDSIFSFFCSLENLHSLFYAEDQCKNKFDGRHLPLLSSCNLEAILLKVKSGRNFKCMFSFHINLTKRKFILWAFKSIRICKWCKGKSDQCRCLLSCPNFQLLNFPN